VEDDPHDPLDVYGKTKSLGEVRAPGMHHLRCSIIGPELTSHRSLLDWFLGQPPGAKVSGFVNHGWNGVTTLHFARLSAAIAARDLPLPPLQHLLPAAPLAKADLLEAIRSAYGRSDLAIERVSAPTAVDRTLATRSPRLSAELWQAAGYPEPPTVPEMVRELASITLTAAA
jgi:dTDP-4-dehydrorhamnose reductase